MMQYSSPLAKHIQSAFLGGWCADAVGARLEFQHRRFTEQEAIDAMHFTTTTITPTSTTTSTCTIVPGQFTDDSEMEIALLQGILNGNDANTDTFPLDHIAEQYIDWYNTHPLDIGMTVTYACVGATNANSMLYNAETYNYESESNGSLMRCVPIATFFLNSSITTLINAAECEASLTHSSEIVKLTTGLYCYIISFILSFIQNNSTQSTQCDESTLNELLRQIHTFTKFTACNTTVTEWINIGLQLEDLSTYNSISYQGHCKHAFIFTIYFLKNIQSYTYERAIKEVLQCGGDTDTNAKIIGSLFGAYYGECIPDYMLQPVLQFNCTDKKQHGMFARPARYGIQHGLHLIQQAIELIDY